MTEYEEIKGDIKTIFSKVTELAIHSAVLSEIVPRIEQALACLPCKEHQVKIDASKEQLYAYGRIGATIYGLTMLVVSVIALIGKLLGWF